MHPSTAQAQRQDPLQVFGLLELPPCASVEIRVRQDGFETARRRHFLRPPFEDYFEVCTRSPRRVKSQLQILQRPRFGSRVGTTRVQIALTLCWRAAARLPPISIETAYGRSMCSE